MNQPDQPASMPLTMADELQEPVWSYDAVTAGVVHPSTPVVGGVVNMRFIGAAVRRGVRTWVVFAIIGLLVGGGLFTTLKRSYQASDTILLTNNPAMDAPTAMQTDALIARDPVVAVTVIKKLDLGIDANSFLKDYAATVTSNQILTITATASTPDVAVAEANAVATEFLAYRTEILQNQQAAIVAEQDQQITIARDNLKMLNSQIAKVSAEPSSSTQREELNSLQVRQDKASSLLASLEQSAGANEASSEVTTASMIKGSQILDTTSPTAARSTKKYAIEYIGGPLFGFLVIGLAVVIIRAVTTDQLRRRDDIAAALGAPVKISVRTVSVRAPSSGSQHPSGKQEADARRIIGYLRSILPERSRGPASLCVVAIDNERAASELVMGLAASLARDGNRVGVADLCDGVLAGLLDVREPGSRLVNIGGREVSLVFPDSSDGPAIGPIKRRTPNSPSNGQEGTMFASADVVLTLASLDPNLGGDHIATWASKVVVLVTAGRSSTSRIQAVGEMVRQAGAQLYSAVLLGTDKDDESLGINIS